MASPSVGAFSPVTIDGGGSPGSRVRAIGGSASKEEAIWRRLKEAGFDEEMIKKRDKTALVSYITKIESELYDYQYNMGLLILEKKEWASKYEQVKASLDSAENKHKRDLAAHASALAEARKQEECLKRALAIEKECVTNIEKALHDMRAESAETKLAYETKLAEARQMMEAAQKKFEEAESKLHSAESLQAEASRDHNAALRNLQDIEAREDELRRRRISFQSECDAKEKELSLQRKSLYDSQRILNQEQERLLEGQTLLNQREDFICKRSKELSCLEKELSKGKKEVEEECRTLKEKVSALDLDMAALATREEAVIERESQLERKERELLVLQEKILSKEYDEVQRLHSDLESSLERKRYEFEVEIEEKRKLFEAEMEGKKAADEERKVELTQKENLVKEKEISIELQLNELSRNQEDLSNRLKLLLEKEQHLQTLEKEAEMGMLKVQKEKEEIKKMHEELENFKDSLDNQKGAILLEQQKLELSIHERNELLILETRLKEEIDDFRSKKMELEAEADRLKAEKEKFEIEWDIIDEKREELRKEADRLVEERDSICIYLKNEYDSLKLEKDNLRNQIKIEAESLSREREEFMSKMEHEHSDWVIKIQRERDDFVRDIDIQRKELENCIQKRQEEVENYLREKEEALEQERIKELQSINSQKEMIAKQLEYTASELKRLDSERMEIALDREQRERERYEIKISVEMLDIQREKLEKQRELLHADREEIYQQIQHLNKLEHLEIELDTRALLEQYSRTPSLSKSNGSLKKCVNTSVGALDTSNHHSQKFLADGYSESKLLPLINLDNASPPLSATVSLVKKYARAIFGRSPKKDGVNSERDDGRNSFLLGREVENIPEIEHKSVADRVVTRLKEDGDTDLRKITQVNGSAMLLNERKRLNDSSSKEIIQKHQKKARQNGGDAAEENPPIC